MEFKISDKMRNMKQGEVSQRYYLKRAYLPLGMEESIYTKEEFYFYPTIAFYTYREDRDQYETTFGAYLESMDRQVIYFVEIMKNYYLAADLHFAMLDYIEKGDIKTAMTLLRADIEKIPTNDALQRVKQNHPINAEVPTYSLC